MSQVPAAADQLQVLAEVWENTQAALDAAAECMKHYYVKHIWEAPVISYQSAACLPFMLTHC